MCCGLHKTRACPGHYLVGRDAHSMFMETDHWCAPPGQSKHSKLVEYTWHINRVWCKFFFSQKPQSLFWLFCCYYAISIFLYYQMLGILLSKGGHRIFNAHTAAMHAKVRQMLTSWHRCWFRNEKRSSPRLDQGLHPGHWIYLCSSALASWPRIPVIKVGWGHKIRWWSHPGHWSYLWSSALASQPCIAVMKVGRVHKISWYNTW